MGLQGDGPGVDKGADGKGTGKRAEATGAKVADTKARLSEARGPRRGDGGGAPRPRRRAPGLGGGGAGALPSDPQAVVTYVKDALRDRDEAAIERLVNWEGCACRASG